MTGHSDLARMRQAASAQNTSSAVMQQRKEPHDSLDDFPTPPWGARALVKHVLADKLGVDARGLWLKEPAVNRGYLLRGLSDYFEHVETADIFDYGAGAPVEDFLFSDPHAQTDWVITNPPFKLAERFIAHGLKVARAGVAMLVRTSFLEGVDRYNQLFSRAPPTVVAQFAERLPMVKGRCDPDASSATSYCWLVWRHGRAPMPMAWIPPCRRKLERPGDYA